MGATPALVWISLVHPCLIHRSVTEDETIVCTGPPIAGREYFPILLCPLSFHHDGPQEALLRNRTGI
jgi:hypothetical protein